MKQTYGRRFATVLLATTLSGLIAGCSGAAAAEKEPEVTDNTMEEAVVEEVIEPTQAKASFITTSLETMTSDGVIDTSDLFTERDLTQEADLVGATYVSLTSGKDVTINDEGVYVLSGTAEDVTVIVDADAQKVQLVLDGASISNADFPAIYVKSADKVFITTTEGSENTLAVTDTFVADGETNTDAVIFSKDDLVLNGLGTLTINSSDNGITSKDDLKITGGTYVINCVSDAIEANDSIRIADGSVTIASQKDGLHAENDEDDTLGYIYICGGSFDIDAGSDAIQGTTYVQIDGGSFTLDSGEAIEATYVQVNGGDITISAWDDGINATYKSSSVGDPVLEIRGGNVSITMAQGDTDALDSNGYLYVSGGTIDIWAQFAFDFDYGSDFSGGTIYVNGEQVYEIAESMMGGMGGFGMGGPGMGGGPGW